MLILICHILITFGFFVYISYRNANNLVPFVDTDVGSVNRTELNPYGYSYGLDIMFSLIFWPIIIFIVCGKFIYKFNLYGKFLIFLKKEKQIVEPEIDEAKSNYRKTVYK